MSQDFKYFFEIVTDFKTSQTTLQLESSCLSTPFVYESLAYHPRLANAAYRDLLASQLPLLGGTECRVGCRFTNGRIYKDYVNFSAAPTFPCDQFAFFALALLECSGTAGALRPEVADTEEFVKHRDRLLQTVFSFRVRPSAIQQLATSLKEIDNPLQKQTDPITFFSTKLADCILKLGIPPHQLPDYLESSVIQLAFRNGFLTTREDLRKLCSNAEVNTRSLTKL